MGSLPGPLGVSSESSHRTSAEGMLQAILSSRWVRAQSWCRGPLLDLGGESASTAVMVSYPKGLGEERTPEPLSLCFLDYQSERL